MAQQQVFYVTAGAWKELCNGIDERIRQARGPEGEGRLISISHAVAGLGALTSFTAILIIETPS